MGEEAGLLSAAEKAGLSLSTIEKLGLLTKAEDLGLISAALNRDTPGLVTGLALALFVAGPAVVYFVPEDSTTLVALQAVVALVCVLGGSAAFGRELAVQAPGEDQKLEEEGRAAGHSDRAPRWWSLLSCVKRS